MNKKKDKKSGELARLLGRTTSTESSVDHERILAILTRYPDLARKCYQIPFFGPLPPLCALLVSSISCQLHHLRAIYELHPEVAEQCHGREHNSPLHLACRVGASDDVVEFLLDRCPSALFTKNKQDKAPLDLLSDGATIGKTGKIVDELVAAILSNKSHLLHFDISGHFWNLPIVSIDGKAIPSSRGNLGTVLSALATASTASELNLSLSSRGSGTSLDHCLDGGTLAHHLFAASPTLERVKIFSGVAHGTNRLRRRRDRDREEIPKSISWDVLGSLLENPSLRELTLEALFTPQIDWFHLLQMDDHGVGTPTGEASLQKLALRKCTVDATSVTELLLRLPNLRELEICDCSLSRLSHEYLAELEPLQPSASRMEKLKLRVGSERSFFRAMMRIWPSLKEMDIVVGFSLSPTDIEEIFPWLSTQGGLEALSIQSTSRDRSVNMDLRSTTRICSALGQNNSLKSFGLHQSLNSNQKRAQFVSMLEKDNTTLEDIGSCCFCGGDSNSTSRRRWLELNYQLLRNKWKVWEVKDQGIILGAFTELLCNVADDCQMDVTEKVQVIFALLSQVPGLWANQ